MSADRPQPRSYMRREMHRVHDGEVRRLHVRVKNPGATYLDIEMYKRQMEGLAVLDALAKAQYTPGTKQTGAVRALGLTSRARYNHLSKDGAGSSLATFKSRLHQDHLTRNSLYLMLNAVLQAGFGFTFWIIAAHLFSAAEVGQASALISAATVIAYLALMGLNNGLGRYLPTAANRDTLISSGLATVAVVAGAIAFGYAQLTPFIAPRVAFIERSPELAIGFALVTATFALNILTNSVFVALRKARYTAFVDGIVGGVGKILLAVAFVGAGTYGLFLASALGIALAAIASLVLIYAVMRCRVSLKRPFEALKPLLTFSGANYVGNIANMLPTLIVPLIVLDRLGAAAAAYYYVVFQVVSILYSAALAIEQTFLAEGSRHNANLRRLKRRSLRILILFCVPSALGLVAVGRWLLLAFGAKYYQYGWPSFILLTLAAGPITAIYWCLTVLRLLGRLRAIVVVNVTYAAAVSALAWFGSAHGLTALTAAWPIGAFVAALVAVVAIPRDQYARHRRRTGAASTPLNCDDKAGTLPTSAASHHRPRPMNRTQKVTDIVAE